MDESSDEEEINIPPPKFQRPPSRKEKLAASRTMTMGLTQTTQPTLTDFSFSSTHCFIAPEEFCPHVLEHSTFFRTSESAKMPGLVVVPDFSEIENVLPNYMYTSVFEIQNKSRKVQVNRTDLCLRIMIF